jgi:hypothetical protein
VVVGSSMQSLQSFDLCRHPVNHMSMRIPKEYSELCISCRLLTIYRKTYELYAALTSSSRGEFTS